MTDWIPELTDDDLTTLVEALEVWETKGAASEIMGDLFAVALSRGDPAAEAHIERQLAPERAKRAREVANRKERSVMLHAKLLEIRNRRRIDEVARRV
jgi:hypothetical protein